jgi:Poly A polymerase head domain/Probable RNA and SrmB- binding site of polymerase A
MDELLREVFADEEAWLVGGAVRDELLVRPVLDVDVVCRDPGHAARAYAKRSGGAPFALSEKHASWRVVNRNGRTVDFTPVHGTIEADLLRRDFTINAIALPVSDGEHLDPCGGREDLQLREIRAVSESVFGDDPLRLVRAVRLADELGFRIAPMTRRLIVDNADLVTRAAGERVLAELERLSADGYLLLAELGLLERLGGSLDGDAIDRLDSPRYRLVAAFGQNTRRLPVSVETRRYARSLLAAEAPPDDSPRAVYRFRRMTEPWASDALVFVGRPELIPAVEAARASEPAAALLRGDELGLPPGPEIGRILDRIAEERAAGTISTRDEALELARREARR